MRIPKRIKIGGATYKILFVDESEILDKNIADYDLVKGVIHIQKNAIHEQQVLSLFHEIIHLININFTEEIVETLAQSLYQVFSDNKFLKD